MCSYDIDNFRDFFNSRGFDEVFELDEDEKQSLSDDEFELVYTACCLHTSAHTHEDITIQTCFDSDRLDLGRVGTIPDPRYLCTDAAKSPDMIAWALENSEAESVPYNVLGQYVLQN